ncbi:MAG: molecular chaperone DnaJ [bacterium]|nr:molecular chaperone DnaJ [bacterium]
MAEDLYATLGLSKGASVAEIKKAYKKMARQYHPDVNKDAGAEDKFKKLQRSYDILSDPKKKSQYDQFGVTDDQMGGGGQGGFGGFGGFSGGGFEDIFETFFGGMGGGARQGGGGRREHRGEDLRYDLEVTLEDITDTKSVSIEIYRMDPCDDCSGSGANGSSGKSTCPECGGAGQVRQVQQTMLGSFTQVATCHVCNGDGQIIKDPCRKCHASGIQKKKSKLQVDVPAGIEDGMKLRMTGKGNSGRNGGPKGDMYVFISVKPHDVFKRDHEDIHVEVDVSVVDAVLGTTINVPTLKGRPSSRFPKGLSQELCFV